MPLNLNGSPVFILSSLGGIEVDAVLNELHQYDSTITDNPVEDGSKYSDNAILEPAVVEMTGRITDASMSILDLRFSGHAVDAFKSLVALQAAREPFEVVTGLNVYTNMMFQSLTFPREASDGGSIRFSAIVREILIVGEDTETNRSRIADDVAHSALPENANGTVPTVAI